LIDKIEIDLEFIEKNDLPTTVAVTQPYNFTKDNFKSAFLRGLFF